jgi:hypothetical protein
MKAPTGSCPNTSNVISLQEKEIDLNIYKIKCKEKYIFKKNYAYLGIPA